MSIKDILAKLHEAIALEIEKETKRAHSKWWSAGYEQGHKEGYEDALNDHQGRLK